MRFSGIKFEDHHCFASPLCGFYLPPFLILFKDANPSLFSHLRCGPGSILPSLPTTLHSSCTNASPLPRETGLQASLYEPCKQVTKRPLLYMVSDGENGRSRDRERDEKGETGGGARSLFGRTEWMVKGVLRVGDGDDGVEVRVEAQFLPPRI